MAVKRQGVPYVALYLWECPECGTTWQSRHRPRAGAELVCAPQSEQRGVTALNAKTTGACGSISVSAGQRKGLAPNVTI